MSVKVNSIGLKGLDGFLVKADVKVLDGVEAFVIVGLPDASVKESRERVATALHSMGYSLVDNKVIVNLTPAEQRKNGPMFDLAIVLAVLKSGNFISAKIPMDAAFIGALNLDGSILPVQGMLPAVLAAKRLGMKKLYLPFDPELPEIEVNSLELVYVETVDDVLHHLEGKPVFSAIQHKKIVPTNYPLHDRDFRQIIGHQKAKRALQVAAAGGHHVMMDGPPGCGKSMLSETFPTILPLLSKEAQLEKISLYQLADAPLDGLFNPPFRHPHHSASAVSIIGGGSNPKPGEVSLAHHGVLFLDELPEFSKKTLDMLRQPLENGKVTISRAHSTVSYPSKFIFVAAMNPCPCGYHGSNKHYCTCSAKQIKAYQTRVSGPIRDRIDILLSLNPVDFQISSVTNKESSKQMRERVTAARKMQYERYQATVTNSEVLYEQLMEVSPLSSDQTSFIQKMCANHGLSNRAQIKVIRLARTISDLKGEDRISNSSIFEAFQYRKVDVKEYLNDQMVGEDHS